MIRFIVLVLSALVLLTGCANPYAKYYTPANISPAAQPFVPADEPRVIRGSNLEADDLRLLEDGYRRLGYSYFNAGPVNENRAVDHAKSLGAAIVVLYSHYTNTVSGSTPLTLPSTQTSTTTLSGMAGGQPVFGTANTTTYGTSTTYIPYNVRRSDYVATYWGRVPTPVLGVVVRDPKPDERRQIGSNTGVVIVAVVKGSPAFSADLFRGDVIKSGGNTPIRDVPEFFAVMSRYAGQAVDVVILRDGKELTKTIQLNPRQ